MAIDTQDPKSIIGVRAPQFLADPRLDDIIELAKLETSKCYGRKYALAVSLRVMHGMTLEALNGGESDGSDTGSGIGGIATDIKEGQISERRGSLSSVKSTLGTVGLSDTVYGQELIRLMRSSFASPINRFSRNCG